MILNRRLRAVGSKSHLTKGIVGYQVLRKSNENCYEEASSQDAPNNTEPAEEEPAGLEFKTEQEIVKTFAHCAVEVEGLEGIKSWVVVELEVELKLKLSLNFQIA